MSTAKGTSMVERVVPDAPWPVVPLGELAAAERNSITDGPFGSKLKTAHYVKAGPRVIRLGNIGNGEFIDAHAHITEAHFAALQKHRVYPGDLVIAALGEDPPRSCLVPDDLGPAIIKADCIRFKAGPRILPRYVNYVLNGPDLRRHAKAIVHGVGRPRLNLRAIKSLPVPVPPIAEQRRIVAEIEKQFTRLDAGVAALRRTQANLKRYRAAVLKAACEGRLVSGNCPKWTQVTVGESVKIIDYRGRTPPLSDSGIPHLRSQNIRHGRIVWHDLAYITSKDFDEFMTRGLPEHGDLLFTTEAPMGEVAAVPTERFSVAQRIMILRPNPTIFESRFLMAQIQSPQFQARLKKSGTGSTVTGVSSRNFQPMVLRVPPLAEQTRIAAEVERRLSVVEELRTVVNANLHRASALRQSVLQHAFDGR